MMTPRIQKLRQNSLDAINTISAERAVLITEFYKSPEARQVSIPVCRAMAFDYLLSKKKICINPGELIVGERGPAPKATPTYPEVCLHTLDDLNMLDKRPKVSYKVDSSVFQTYEEIVIPFWKGQTNRERIMNNMHNEWHEAYAAGVFTEFQEQRAPGHTAGGSKIFEKGMSDIINDIETTISSLDFFNDPEAYNKLEELKAMKIAALAIIKYANRHAEELEKLALAEKNLHRKQELKEIAAICRNVPKHKPQTFHEALQHYWFIHVGVITELNPWDSFNPGRLDQHLYPFFVKETEQGTLSRENTVELLQSFWVKFNNHPAPPKVGVTALESSTYTDFALINLGGVKVDGSDAVNELSYIILDVIEEMRLLQPSSMIQVSKKNPDFFIQRAVKITKTGFGQPSMFNTDAIVQQLVRQGKSIEDARNGGASGCVESGAFGTEAYFLTGYFNLAKVLELTLNNGTDPQSGKLIGIKTGNPNNFKTYNDLLVAFSLQLNYFINIKIKGNNIIEQIIANNLPAPFLSLVIEDCVANGKDYNAGGARYNTSYIQGVGLGSITDSLTAIRYHVFDEKNYSLSEIIEALKKNFKGEEELRYRLIHETPKYGNDDDYADQAAQEVFEIFYKAVNGRPNSRGGKIRINMLPTTSHVYFGSKIDALPDGRKAKEPLSEGISPVQGADRNGPTAVLKSASKIDHILTGGTLLNQKFTPSFFNDNESIARLTHLIRGYFRLDGHHVQFNVVSAKTLKEAQKNPEKYRDLIVRVAGYSDYFNDLSTDLQNEIIRRTEHSEAH
ncbi:MAG TPA: glycyl radical protein [Bacteroidales bacterium]|nr:glycyl radical protein [Bacteroidales bacterium]HQO07310.1 glycyl radical protein [Bacteroidales bacterium]HQP54006.1 glycyl radical protein [Bacteroidales bacterium]